MLSGTLDQQPIPILLDSGSDVSVVSVLFLTSSLPNSALLRLRLPCVCYPFNDSPDRVSSDNASSVLTVKTFIVTEISFLSFHVSFPVLVYPAYLPSLILGNDFLSCLNIGINISNSCLVIPGIPSGQSPESHIASLCSMATRRGSQYQRSLLTGAPFELNPLSASTINWMFKLDHSSLVKGVDIPAQCSLVYPCKGSTVSLFSNITISCQISSLTLRKGLHYVFYPISRPWNPVRFPAGPDYYYCHDQDDTNLIRLTFSSPSQGQLYKSFPCAYVLPTHACRVTSISDLAKSLCPSHPVYPEFSQFKPKAWSADLPLPAVDGSLPDVPDYSPLDWQEIAAEKDQWISEVDGKWFMYPKPTIKIPFEMDDHEGLRHAILAKQLSKLPDGVWYQEDPSILPGVPMSDVAVRVRLTSSKPISAKPRRMSSTEHAQAVKQLSSEVALGLFEPSKSPWSSNITWAKKADGSLRICLDFRPVNEVSVKDKYPLPRLEDIVANLSGKTSISLVDITKGFNNLHVHPDDRDFLAFNTPLGLLRPVRLPFGWTNGPPVFQREVDLTLSTLGTVFRGYIDDISGGTCNQRVHDLLLSTVLYNFHIRGFRFHSLKAQLLPKWLHLVGWSVNGTGSKPHPAPGIFDALLARDHSDLRSVQRTLGTLQWFQTYVPNFSYVVLQLAKLLKSENRQGNRVNFTTECRTAIETIKTIVEELPLHAHPNSDLSKEVFIACGSIAFATSVHQLHPGEGKQIVQFWSKRWCNDVTNYNKADRMALAVRETVRHFQPILSGSPSIDFYMDEPTFLALVSDPTSWTPRMHKYLAHTIQFNPSYHSLPLKYRRDLDLLSHPIAQDELPADPVRDKFPSLVHFFSDLTDKQIREIPVVHTDGGCIQVGPSKSRGAVGVFWGPLSSFNLSQLSTRIPFSNQRAELEAILQAILIARQRQLKALILISDSAYAVDCLNIHRFTWTVSLDSKGEVSHLSNSKGLEPKNSDLFKDIINALTLPTPIKVFFEHVKRCDNVEADSLVNDAFRREFPSRFLPVSAVVTRSQTQQSQPSTIPEWTPAASMGPDAIEDDFECYIPIYEDSSEGSASPREGFCDATSDSNLDIQLNQPPPPDNEDVESDASADSDIPSESSLPQWTMDIVDPVTRSSPRSSSIFQMDPNQLNRLLEIMTLLPEAQREDPLLSSIRESLLSPAGPTGSGIPADLHKYSLCDRDGALTYLQAGGHTRIVVPASLQVPIIELFHKSPILGGHATYRPTYMHIQRYFHWKKMSSMIKSYCSNCAACKVGRNQHGRTPGFLTQIASSSGPFFRVHADTIRCLPNSNGYRHVLVVMDSFTKYVFTHPLKSGHPQQIVDGLTLIFSRFGQPAIFIADNGGEFRNKEVVTFLELWGVQWKFPSSYNPQANGQAEAAVKIISSKLRLTISELRSRGPDAAHEKKWSIFLPYITMSYNFCPNEMTGFSPYELVFGRIPPLPSLVTNVKSLEENWTNQDHRNYLVGVQQALKEAYAIVDVRARARRQHLDEVFNRSRAALEISPGDFTYILKPFSEKLQKFEPRAVGPYLVTDVTRHPISNDVVSIECDITPVGESVRVFKRFPRRRIRPVAARLPNTNWDNLFHDYGGALPSASNGSSLPFVESFNPAESVNQSDPAESLREVSSLLTDSLPVTASGRPFCILEDFNWSLPVFGLF